MSREIKFRYYSPSSRKMAGWEIAKQYTGAMLFEHENIIPMQFTGLKDCKGVEIYEHDILRLAPEQSDFARFVEYMNGEWVVISADLESISPLGVIHTSHETAIVVGNLHENDNLLEIKP